MKKLNFFNVLLLAGVIVTQPLVSCTAKDYDADIDRINKEIADVKTSISALDQAIKSGKLITKVIEVTGGWEITFSDNSKITVKHGANGTDGKPGLDGKPGTAGTDGFAPILGIDAQGYWTVITTKGGAPARMKDASGNEVKAVASVPSIGANDNWFIDGVDTGKPARGDKGEQGEQGPTGPAGKSPYIGENGNWFVINVETGEFEDSEISAKVIANISVDEKTGELKIDGKPTGRFVPPVVFNTLNNKLMVNLKDEDGVLKDYEIALSQDVLSKTSIVSLMVESMTLDLKYGTVVDITDAAQKAKRDEFISKTTGDLLFNEIRAAFIVNPTNADLQNNVDTMFLISADGKEYLKLRQEWTPFKFEDSFIQTRSNNATALWTACIVEPTKDQLVELRQATESGSIVIPTAVKVKTGERSVVSNYGYRLRSANMGSFGNIVDKTYPNRVTIGLTTDATSVYSDVRVPMNGKSNIGGINPYNYYKAELKFNDSKAEYKTANDEVRKYIALSGMNFSTNRTDAKALDNKEVYFTIRMVDYTGAYYELESNHKFTVGVEAKASATVNHTLVLKGDMNPTTKLYANQKLVNLVPLFDQLTPDGLSNTNLTGQTRIEGIPAHSGITYAFVKADASATITHIAGVDCKGLRFEIDPSVAVPGTYDIVMTATGSTTSGGRITATQNVKLVIANPAVPSIKNERTGLFAGDLLTVYGNFDVLKKYSQVQDPTYYSVLTAYSKDVTPESDYYFEAVMTAEEEVKYENPFFGDLVNFDDFAVTNKNVNQFTYKVNIKTPMFGNQNNMVIVDQIQVLAKSEVAMGSIYQQTGKSIDLTNGQAKTVKLSEVFAAKDVYGNNLSLFLGGQNERVVTTAVKVSGVNSSLVSVARSDNEWTISTIAGSAVLSSDIQIPLEITITDKLGAKKVLTTTFTLKKNI